MRSGGGDDNGPRSGVSAVATRTLYGQKNLPMGVRTLTTRRLWDGGLDMFQAAL